MYSEAYENYIKPVQGSGERAVRCGTICRCTPGEAEALLRSYLNRIAAAGVAAYNSFVEPEQLNMGNEQTRPPRPPAPQNLIEHILPYFSPPPPAFDDTVPCPSLAGPDPPIRPGPGS